jgi:hypothetical protein
LLEAALDIAMRTGRMVYDSLYVALAVQMDCRLVTANEKLYNALKDGPLGPRILWVEGGLLKILGFRRFLGLLDWRNLLRYPRRRKEPIVTEGSENGYACLSESQGGPSVSQPTPGARANVSK